ncbi:MAG: sel1 repeat family protein [Opitutaceae bacterium]|nr:sel1 repeat family protein [Opitutaceae bacterium]
MSVIPPSRPTPWTLAVLGVLAFALLAVRFSPNWIAFQRVVREAKAEAESPAHLAAIDRAVFSGHSERGLHVIRQAHDLNAEIDNSVHKIVRWRLLVPAVAHVLRLPDGVTLGLAHVGCLALALVLVGIGLGRSRAPEHPRREAFCLAVIAGASAPFFTSMGWVGYYDSLLALTLLGVAFARPRWVVVAACLTGPWIDERFVLGFPLALGIRWLLADRGTQGVLAWGRQQALIPCLLVAAYAVLRLSLGGSGGSQTVMDYLDEFVFSGTYPGGQRLLGAWEGLRLGWVLVGVAVTGTWLASRAGSRMPAGLLATGIVLTGVIGLFTALDMSRSMVLLLPAVPLGWVFAVRTTWWRRYHAGPILAGLAVVLPASQVVAHTTLSVDALWSYSVPQMTAENNLGLLYAKGEGVPIDGVRAARWLRRPAEEGVAIARNNLGLLYAMGRGVKHDNAEAAKWFLLAADQGVAVAQENLGVLYANGDGVPKDLVQAHRWLNLSVLNGQTTSAEKLATIERVMSPADIARARALAQQWIEERKKKPASPGP